MSVHLTLARESLSYTTFDTVSGTVTIKLPVPTSVSTILVKLEGEATTSLTPETGDKKKDKKNVQAEVHKVLYYIHTVFPAPEVLRCSAPGATWTISPGRYNFPFSFQIPYESECIKNTHAHANNFGDLLLDNNRDMYNNVHIRAQLPPSLDGPQKQANIVYFVKATVVRPAFYHSNYRAITRITHIPCEPQRPEISKDEAFARRQYAFGTSLNRSQSLLPRLMRKGEPVVDFTGDQPSFCVDARLPSPSILTCSRPVPLRIVIKKLNDSSAPLHLNSLDIEVVGYTHVRARHLRRTETAMWSVLTLPHLDTCVADGSVTAGAEWELEKYWIDTPLPDVVAPSFTTCNLSRNYELQVRLGFSNGPLGSRNVQTTVLPLKLNCDIFSGIVPPPHILATHMPMQHLPPSPIVSSPGPPPQPPRPAVPPSIPQESADDAPPPSYEDAVAETLQQAAVAAQSPRAPNNRSPSARKPVPPPDTSYAPPAAASYSPMHSDRSTPQPDHQPPPGPPPGAPPRPQTNAPPGPPPGPPPRAQTAAPAEPPSGPPPGPPPAGRSATMPAEHSTTPQPNLLDDSPDFGPDHIDPQATGNNPFAEYLTGPTQPPMVPQPSGQVNNRQSTQSSLLDTSPVYSPTLNSPRTQSPSSNNPFAQYVDPHAGQTTGSNQGIARDVSAQIDQDQALAERLQRLEMETQEQGTISTQSRPGLPPRPVEVHTSMPNQPATGVTQSLSPTATGNNPFASYLPAPQLPPRPPSTQAPPAPSQSQPPNYFGQ